MIFEYASDQRFQEELEINHIGNCAIKALTFSCLEYYLLIRTDAYGTTTAISFGPLLNAELIIQEIAAINKPEMFYNIQKFGYNERSINKLITTFLRKPKMKEPIVSAMEIPTDDVISILPDMRCIE